MKPELRNNLLYTKLSVSHKGSLVDVDNILIDTGSATTVISADILLQIGIRPEPGDAIRTIRGVGGTEAVFSRIVDYVRVDNSTIENFEIEVAGMDFGFIINGILGMDFLIPSGAILNLRNLEVNFA